MIETTELEGSFEQSYRRSFSNRNESGLREQLESYVQGHYLAESLGEIEQMSTLIDNLFELAKLDAREIELDR